MVEKSCTETVQNIAYNVVQRADSVENMDYEEVNPKFLVLKNNVQ